MSGVNVDNYSRTKLPLCRLQRSSAMSWLGCGGALQPQAGWLTLQSIGCASIKWEEGCCK